ncbi:hypothetical protein MPNTM1_03575 [Mycolicibacterium parafortuitum]|uniref:DUF7162 family protein n=1 Tax=Mycolicibacterium parafortuitum TaxID=39692 RepID=UPI000CF22399|nr:hypothetical protein CYL16_22615 [Mycobacterium sp. EPG1]
MGEIAHVDPDRLIAAAACFGRVADDVARERRPALDPAALAGAAVAAVDVDALLSDAVAAVVAGLNDWAGAARASAESFRQTDTANGARFGPR